MHFIEIDGEYYSTNHIVSVRYEAPRIHQPTQYSEYEAKRVPVGREESIPAQLTLRFSTGIDKPFSGTEAENAFAALMQQFPTLKKTQA